MRRFAHPRNDRIRITESTCETSPFFMLSSTTPWKYDVFCIPNVIWISCFMTNLSSGKPDGSHPVRSSYRGTSYTAPASLICPRRASDLLGAERCDPQPSRVKRCHAAGTPRRVDEAVRTSCSPVSIGCCILVPQQTVFLPDASSCGPRSTFVRRARDSDSRDACREPSVCMACPSPPFLISPT